MPLAVGEAFAGYHIVRVLGAGAMGTVYLAQHPRLPRHDALKVLSAELTADPQYRARFLREADIAATLSHPNILGVHDRGEYGGQFWIAMDYVMGTDAARLLREQYGRGMPIGEALPIISGVASALDHAHRRGLLHRDVKPANILLTEPEDGARRIFLADFGIARRIDDTAGLTARNIAVGTVAYAAPEQLMGEPVSAPVDQYALACTAFHLLSGAVPYEFSSAAVVITKHVMAPPPPIGEHRPELAGLNPVFAKAMAKAPADRFGSCQEFARELQHRLTAAPEAPLNTSGPINVQDTQWAPTMSALLVPPPAATPAPAPKKSRVWRPKVLIPVLLAVALLIAGGIFAVVKGSGSQHHNPTVAAPPNTPEPNSGPFTGNYRADYAPSTDINDGPLEGSAPSTGAWAVRSVCRPTGCVAMAKYVGEGSALVSSLVFDDVGGSWVAVGLGTDKCRDKPDEFWVVFRLQPRPDGSFAGETIRATGNACNLKRSITFTRTGDVDIGTLPDPAAQAPRVVSPAEALGGRYHYTVTFAKAKAQEYDQAVRTECLRTGDRCMSYFHGPTGAAPLVFGDGKWIENLEFDGPCPKGGTSHVKITAEYLLPQPPQDPITLLTEKGRQEESGSACPSNDFSAKFVRTGD